MRLLLRPGNVLDAPANALLLPVDGAARGMEGNVARQFQRRWGDAWEQIDSAAEFPIPLGAVACIETTDPLPFRAVFLLSVLSHRDNDHFAGYLRSALDAAFAHARRLGLRSLASPLLRGGWRTSASSAFRTMLDAVDARRDDDATLSIYSLLPEHHDYLVDLARSFGLRDDG